MREKKKKNVTGIKPINVIINVLGIKVIITAHICSFLLKRPSICAL